MYEIETFISELEAMSEAMNDACMSLLSQAIENGESTRPAEEKKLSQARRAVDKAVLHLRSV
jgi:hypothetical protein